MILLGDLEANQLEIDSNLIVHCIVLMDYDTKKIYQFPPDKLVGALHMINDSEKVVFHNYIGYDKKVLNYKYPKLKPNSFDDTLIMSRLFDPDRRLHSIEAYGIECGTLKPEHEEWHTYTKAMLKRCTEDVRILEYTYTKLQRERQSTDWEEALELEYDVALAHNEQIKRGVQIDLEAAHKLISKLDGEVHGLDDRIKAQLPLRCAPGPEVNRIFKKNGDYYANIKKYFDLP